MFLIAQPADSDDGEAVGGRLDPIQELGQPLTDTILDLPTVAFLSKSSSHARHRFFRWMEVGGVATQRHVPNLVLWNLIVGGVTWS